jgi:hypothetical protein
MLTRYKGQLKLKDWVFAVARRSTMRKARIEQTRMNGEQNVVEFGVGASRRINVAKPADRHRAHGALAAENAFLEIPPAAIGPTDGKNAVNPSFQNRGRPEPPNGKLEDQKIAAAPSPDFQSSNRSLFMGRTASIRPNGDAVSTATHNTCSTASNGIAPALQTEMDNLFADVRLLVPPGDAPERGRGRIRSKGRHHLGRHAKLFS